MHLRQSWILLVPVGEARGSVYTPAVREIRHGLDAEDHG